MYPILSHDLSIMETQGITSHHSESRRISQDIALTPQERAQARANGRVMQALAAYDTGASRSERHQSIETIEQELGSFLLTCKVIRNASALLKDGPVMH